MGCMCVVKRGVLVWTVVWTSNRHPLGRPENLLCSVGSGALRFGTEKARGLARLTSFGKGKGVAVRESLSFYLKISCSLNLLFPVL